MGNASVDDAALIERGLELVAMRLGDPATLVYARLFADHPELEVLFVRDRVGMVRVQMLHVALECLADFAGPHDYSANFLCSERVNHAGLGVPPAMFDLFYSTMIDTFRAELGPEWTVEMDAAWRRASNALVAAAA